MKCGNQLHSAESDEDWTRLVERAAIEVFALMLGSQLTVGTTAEESKPGVTSMVGLAGQLCAVLSIRCSEKAAMLMASKMLDAALDKVGPEMSDAIGEVCNMVAGNFKNKIAGLEDGCVLSPPTVIAGSDYDLHSHADFPGLALTLLFEGMPIVISLQINSYEPLE